MSDLNRPSITHAYPSVTRTEDLGFCQLTVRCFENMDRAVDDTWKDLCAKGEGQRFDDLCPYFGQVWDSARVMCRWMSDRPADWSGRRVLEIGCGLGLPSMIAARLGADVIAADFHPAVGEFLVDNLRLNNITGVTYRQIDWRVDDANGVDFDWILAADVLYERTQAEPLSKFLRRVARPNSRVVIADPGRPYQTAFINAMEDNGFELIDMVGDPPSANSHLPVTLFTLRLRQP